MTQSQPNPLTPFAPLPVRARGTLEIFDTAFKLFRRYAGVLLAWSFLSAIVNLIPVAGSLLYLFTMPFAYGAVSCAVAAAVRGQNITFKQAWGFTKPRYGALLGVLILAWILLFIAVIAAMFVGGLVTFGFVALVGRYGAFATGISWIVGTLVVLVGTTVFLSLALGWFNVAPIIACLEDGNRGANALSRAGALMSGNWRKVCAVATIAALMGGAIFIIVGGFILFFLYGGWDKFLGASTSESFFSNFELTGFYTLYLTAWTPIQAVVGAVFYLDLRTRKEALDLEWTNYAAKPEMAPDQMASAPSYPPTDLGPAPTIDGPPYISASSFATAPQEVPRTPIYMAQAPGQSETPTDVSIPVAPVAADSFSNFAAQVESQSTPPTPQPFSAIPAFGAEVPPAVATTIELGKSPLPSEPTSPIEYAIPPVPDAPVVTPPAPVAAEPEQPVFPSVAPLEVEAAPIPVTAIPVPPPTPQTPPASSETSSFAPPPRFRRAPTEEDDFPSSFGGGTQ